MITGTVPAEIRDGPRAIRATVDDAGPVAREVAGRWRAEGIRRVHVIGNGTSFHSTLASAALYRRHAGPRDPVVVPVTAADFVTYPPALGQGDAIVGISSSGEFKDVVAAAERHRGRLPFAAVVHVPGSTLTGLASDVVLSAGGPSTVPVMTKTFSSTLAATELLLLELLGDGAGDALRSDLRRAADAADASIAAAEPLVEALAEELRDARHLFVTGGGLGYPAALEAALKLKEMALVHAEGAEAWEMTSGAATMLGPDAVVIALAPVGPARAGVGDLLGHAAEWGARTVEVGPERLVATSALLPLPPDAAEDHAPLSAVPPVALLAFALALVRGANPDRPDWIERYHSQGLRHIIGAGTEVQA
ncbi:MAG TPA: SIS domain-containing protein [Candidatus Limnocylindrales bacterium]|nr:SIS domain-containing protein [Candidatus Limnocylindrales bacterium]